MAWPLVEEFFCGFPKGERKKRAFLAFFERNTNFGCKGNFLIFKENIGIPLQKFKKILLQIVFVSNILSIFIWEKKNWIFSDGGVEPLADASAKKASYFVIPKGFI